MNLRLQQTEFPKKILEGVMTIGVSIIAFVGKRLSDYPTDEPSHMPSRSATSHGRFPSNLQIPYPGRACLRYMEEECAPNIFSRAPVLLMCRI